MMLPWYQDQTKCKRIAWRPFLCTQFAFVLGCYLRRLQTNKYVHIYSGWFAYVAGLAQCYRGLELVSGTQALVFEGYDVGFTVSSSILTYVFHPKMRLCY